MITYITDKLPHNFENIGLIRTVFPNSRIIHVTRDSADTAISNYFTDYAAKNGGMGFAYDLTWIAKQIIDERRLTQHWDKMFPGSIFHLRYEELVSDPVAQIQRLLEYLDLPWEDNILSFQDVNRSVKTASVWQVRQPIYSSSKGRSISYAKHLEDLETQLSQLPKPISMKPYLSPLSSGVFAHGMALLQKERFREASDCFDRIISVYPAHAAAIHFRGVALLRQGQLDEAIELLRRSVRLRPNQESWQNNLKNAETLLPIN
jgi:tetratricopeptide (TPR) repeat protein